MSMGAKISRRKFILIALLAIGAASIASFIYLDFDKILFKILKNDLSYLKVKDDQIEKFIKEARNQNHWKRKYFDWKKQLFMRFGYMIDSIWQTFPYAYKYRQYKSEIVGDFLLSTDFFLNEMDENQQINYIGLYNPYKRACSNPFSNLYYPAA